jgi:hypothetical protein
MLVNPPLQTLQTFSSQSRPKSVPSHPYGKPAATGLERVKLSPGRGEHVPSEYKAIFKSVASELRTTDENYAPLKGPPIGLKPNYKHFQVRGATAYQVEIDSIFPWCWKDFTAAFFNPKSGHPKSGHPKLV